MVFNGGIYSLYLHVFLLIEETSQALERDINRRMIERESALGNASKFAALTITDDNVRIIRGT